MVNFHYVASVCCQLESKTLAIKGALSICIQSCEAQSQIRIETVFEPRRGKIMEATYVDMVLFL